MIGQRGTCSWIACALLSAAALACSSPGTPTPTPTPTSFLRLQMSGRVLDESAAPVAGATVEVDLPSGGGVSWVATHTDTMGAYAIEFDATPGPNRGFGYVYAFRHGYEVDVQWVPVGPSPVVRDLRIRASSKIVPGGSTVVSVGPTSSLCTDLEDLWVLESRCEIVVIESGPGTLTVEARATSGGVTPSMYWYTTGNYAGFIERPGPGIVSIPVKGGTYRVLVGLPEGSAAQQLTVTTSLR